MTASTRSATNFHLYLRGTAAILMTVMGFAFMIGGALICELAHTEKYIGPIEGCSVALVFGGVAVALKTVEKLHMAEEETLTD